jgi:lipopolysaccharide transport system ATP-binding protein
MTMRLAFAVSVCLEPEVLIIDEALSVGDAVFQFKCRSRLESLIAGGTTLLFVSHDMGAVKSFCNRVIYLKEGMITAEGTPEDLTELYFMDVRSEQASQLVPANCNKKPTMIGDKLGGGWGSDKGEIVKFFFSGTGTVNAIFRRNEFIEVEVLIRVAEQVTRPFLSLLIQTQALVNLGGRRISLESAARHDGQLIRVKFNIEPQFSRGLYFVTLRLEEKRGYEQYFPIHKMPGALNFEVAIDEECDLGNCLHIGMTAEVDPGVGNGNFS